MGTLKSIKVDSTFVKVYDSSNAVSEETQHIIIIKDNQTLKENGFDWLGSFWVPVLIFFIGGLFTYIFGWRKMKSIIRNLESSSIKSETEVSKLKSETQQIKKSFQPIVVGTIQSVRDKLIDKKINALEKLAEHSSQFMEAGEQFYGPDGEPISDLNDYYDSMFLNYSPAKFDQFKKYKNEFSFFFGVESYEIFQELFRKVEDLVYTRDTYFRQEVEQDPGMDDHVKTIIKTFETLSKSLRSELHLDNRYIEDFIAANQLNKES